MAEEALLDLLLQRTNPPTQADAVYIFTAVWRAPTCSKSWREQTRTPHVRAPTQRSQFIRASAYIGERAFYDCSQSTRPIYAREAQALRNHQLGRWCETSCQAAWLFYTSVHLTLTTQMMAEERHDSQIGHALAQGPLMTDILAGSSAALWFSSKSVQSGRVPKTWTTFQTTLPTSDRVLGGNEGWRDWWAAGETWPVLRRPVCEVAAVEGPAVLQGPAASNQAAQHQPVPFQHHLLSRSAASQVGSHLWHKQRTWMVFISIYRK